MADPADWWRETRAWAQSTYPKSFNIIEKFIIDPTHCVFKGRIINGEKASKSEVLTAIRVSSSEEPISRATYAWIDEGGVVQLGLAVEGYLKVHVRFSDSEATFCRPFCWLSLDSEVATPRFAALVRYYLCITASHSSGLAFDRTTFKRHFRAAILEVWRRNLQEDQQSRVSWLASLGAPVIKRSCSTIAIPAVTTSPSNLALSRPKPSHSPPHSPSNLKPNLCVADRTDESPRKRPRTLDETLSRLKDDLEEQTSAAQAADRREKRRLESRCLLEAAKAERAEKALEELKVESEAMIGKCRADALAVEGKAKADVEEAERKARGAEERMRVAEDEAHIAEQEVQKLKAQLKEIQKIQEMLKGALAEQR